MDGETTGGERLRSLEAAVSRDLHLTRHPEKAWMPTRKGPGGAHLYDVVIAGAGQGGLAVAFALQRMRIDNILVVDRAAYGREGIWTTYARMPTLRSPKEFTGPDLGVASLTYQAWHEARFGREHWERLHRIPKEHWQEYLLWYRAVLALPVRNETTLVAITPDNACLRLGLETPCGTETVVTRKLVLATGQDGLGRWLLPDFVERLPQHLRATTSDDIDFAALAGKTIAVLGAGASAADNAATALEAGAAKVMMFVRRPALQRVQPYLWLTFSGFLHHMADMDDHWRWKFMRHILELRESMPQETYDRCRRHAGFSIHVGAGWEGAEAAGDHVQLRTAAGDVTADFLIVGAGIDIDPSARPELASFAGEIATWADRYDPRETAQSPRLARFPYHAPDGSFLERCPGAAPFLARIHDFTIATTMSFGPFGCSINAMTISAPRLARGITQGLFREDLELHWASLQSHRDTIFEPAPVDRDKIG
ncbi:MAG TPA: NAD(P)/FAD-dependent oxidoreductase [Hyphomicrobiaceae bacterium]|nr:NAD(P)/FAD-dependent oxidoreductase [Hyphomicrobiaceae bacterium]